MLEKIVEGLEEKIKVSLKNADLKDIFSELSNIDEASLTIGVGGSKVVSLFLEKVLSKKNKIIVRDIDIDEYFLKDFDTYKNVIIVSHSGKNHGVKSVLSTGTFKKYLLTSRKSKINGETVLRYENSLRIKSFVAIEDMFIPLGIILAYYLDVERLPSFIFEREKFNFRFRENVDIVYDYESKCAAKFLEVALVESGVAHVSMHDKYSLCHGRSNTISSFKSLVVYFSTRDGDIDDMLRNNLVKITDDLVFLSTLGEDKIVGDFVLVWKVLNLINYISEKYQKEFVSVKYNEIIPTIYNFKGDFR